MAPTRTRDRADRRPRLLVGSIVVAGGVAVAGSLAAVVDAVTRADRPSYAVLLAVIVLVLVGDRLNVEVRVRSARLGSCWTDVAVLIAFALVPVPWVVLAATTGVALSKAVRRVRPGRAVFGMAKEALTVTAGGAVLLALGASGSPAVEASLGALALAFVVMAVVDDLLFFPVVALSTRTRAVDRYRENWDIRHVMLAGRLAVALAAVLALRLEQTLLYALPFAVFLAYVWHERWVRAREERQAWQNLARATGAFTGVDLDVVLREAVLKGATLFSADELEVEIWLADVRRLVRGGEEIGYDGDPAAAPAARTSVYAVALHGYPGQPDIGAIRLRFRDRLKISEREEAMLSAYAAALDTAVRNAAAYLRLDEAKAAHAHAAAHDALTGLANRRELERYLIEALSGPRLDARRIALVLLDLRHFKEVNDALGHLAGDRVLAQIARRLTAAAGPADLVARFGGDEFAVLLRDARQPAAVEARALRLLATFGEQLEVDGLPIMVEANGGLALALDPQDEPDRAVELEAGLAAGPDGEPLPAPAPPWPVPRADPHEWMGELLRRADVAMYQAKRLGQRLARYTAANDPADRERLLLAGQLRRAVSEREFTLRFQPIVDIASGEVVGAEALARWRHPTRGELAPRWFLDLLERSAQLPAFTAAVLDDALAAAGVWRAAGHDLSVSVNISARSLLDPGFPHQVLAALDRHGTRPDRLCLELTETLALSQLDTVDQVLTRLHDMGVRLALDDFGTGYSSIGVLSRIAVHQIKIDRSFVTNLRTPGLGVDDAAQARAVVRSTLQLGRALDLAVIAEGIESDRHRVLLWELGCTLGQGHMFSPPVPAEELLALLTRGVGGRAGALASPLPEDATVVRLPRRRAR